MSGRAGATWQTLSRAVGLAIVILLLGLFMVASVAGMELDRAITLAFLGIASALIGLPSGWQLVRRNGGSSS